MRIAEDRRRSPFTRGPLALLAAASLLVACADGGGTCDLAYCDQVLIPAGVFPMGSAREPMCDAEDDPFCCDAEDVPFGCGDERPVHWVRLDAFYIDAYEVTYERYEDCVRHGPCRPNGGEWGEEAPTATSGKTVVNHYPPACDTDEGGSVANCLDHAVNCKTWEQADTYCRWIGRRLCTEAEWERAANGPGPDQRTYPWGDEVSGLEQANFSKEYIQTVDDCAAGRSAEGVYNLAGNVEEWVADFYGLYENAPEEAPLERPAGPATGELRITRGGCFLSGIADTDFEYGSLRNSARATQAPGFDWG